VSQYMCAYNDDDGGTWLPGALQDTLQGVHIPSMQDLEGGEDERERMCACMWLLKRHRQVVADEDDTVMLYEEGGHVPTGYVHLYPSYLVREQVIQMCDVFQGHEMARVGEFAMPMFTTESLMASWKQRALIDDIMFLYCHPTKVKNTVQGAPLEVCFIICFTCLQCVTYIAKHFITRLCRHYKRSLLD
jgi:hypothetical protein